MEIILKMKKLADIVLPTSFHFKGSLCLKHLYPAFQKNHRPYLHLHEEVLQT